MGAHVLTVINFWSQIDNILGELVAKIAGADPVTVTAVYQTMVSAEAKKSALVAAARASLCIEDAALIQAVLESCESARKQRNDFVHHLWGYIPGRSDCVLLMAPKEALAWSAQMSAWAGTMREKLDEPPAIDRFKIMVWRLEDFQKAEQAALLAHRRTFQLQLCIGHPAKNKIRQALLDDPNLVRRYERILREANV